MHLLLTTAVVCLLCGQVRQDGQGSWPGFRGPNAAGHAVGDQPLPDRLGPDENVLWKTPLPPGHSSPAIVGDRIYLTGVRDNKLLTLALDRASGKLLWETESPFDKLEEVHRIGNRAQPSPTSDGEYVVSFFGSSGLVCHDASGKQRWRVPMGPFKNEFGAGASPLLFEDKVLLNQDHDEQSALMCFSKQSGSLFWKVDRSEFPRGYASPMIWTVDGKHQVVIAGTLRVVGYDLDTGKELWTVRGLARVMNMTPVVGDDNTLYVAGWAAGGDAEERFNLEPFAELMAKQDANKNGLFDEKEVPEGPLTSRYKQFDRDKNGHVTRDEYETMRQIFEKADNLMLAIRPGGAGDITETHVLWTQKKFLPYIPSPLYHEGHLYMVKDGGILSSIDGRTGKPVKQGRVAGTGSYYSSPVVGDGKLYLIDSAGVLSVVKAQPQWEVLSSAKFEDDALATPALVDGKIYLRTEGYLYCFGAAGAN